MARGIASRSYAARGIACLLWVDDVHDEEVAGFPEAIFLDHDPEVVGVTGLHGVAAEVIDEAVDLLVAPYDCCGGRGEMEVEDFAGDGGVSGTESGARKEVGEELFHVRCAVDADAEGVLPDDVVCVGGDDFFGIEFVPAFLFAG